MAKQRLHSGRLAPDWPFSVQRSPIYYGWVIWLLSTLGFLCSVPGQTMGMGVFTESFMDAFGLTRTQLSSAYLFGTLGSAVLLTWAGRLFDKHGARTMLVGSSVGLGLVILLISSFDLVLSWLPSSLGANVLAFGGIALCYFGVRFFGQGVLTSASRNVLLLWFEQRRGLVSGVRGVFVSLGFSLAPLLLGSLIITFGWRETLWILAVILIGGYALLALVFVRDDPRSCGLLPDGAAANTPPKVERYQAPDQSLRVAQRSPLFWLYASGLSIHALFGTAVTFHVVDIFAQAGRDQAQAFGYFFPTAIVSTSTNLLASLVVDRMSLQPFLLIMLAAFGTGAVGLLQLETTSGYWLLVLGFGIGGGLWGVLSNLANIRFFGSLHLGEISGFSTSISVFASAIGPAAFAMSLELTGSYAVILMLCLAANLALLVIAALLTHPDKF